VEPMKTYLSGTHSVFAWTLPEEEAKKQVLTGAVNLLSGDKTPVASSALADELCKTAQFFLINARRSKSDDDIASAQKQYRLMTEQYPTDYRGWLGLAVCECMLNISSIEDASERLGNAAKYYSYVVSAGCDAAASPEYTHAKSELWRKILAMISSGMEECTTLESAQKFRTTVLLLNHRFGHTTPEIEQQYNALLAQIDEAITRYEKARDDAKKARDDAEIAKLFAWRGITTTEVELAGVKSKTELTGDLAIPKIVNGRFVRAIGNSAFWYCTGLTSITIPDSVKSIGDSAFSGCTGLKSVTIHNSVTSIGNFAFEGCTSLTSITIPDSVTSIGVGVFSSCMGLTSITIANSNKSYCDIHGVLFNRDKTELLAYPNAYSKEYTIPDSVKCIGKYAFECCTSLTSITIPDSVTSINWGAFEGCTSLTSIIIPDSVTSIGEDAFYGCTNLTSITINNAKTSIHSWAFHDCPNLTIYSTGGFFSPVRKYARRNRVKYKKIK